ncbi:BlaR1 family beta-lactam sensor/signal transducer [Parablautia muri]|uniref:BlaR1 family beta-lactam sensor/signal transducer n=1 Tax=Parablautia muri TaxID=2320879 RepID=A0A9X5GV10_9FIRM|nr:BlaR1 family beta-lactam sensor/signal transducer [Parablautia muri]NBJ94662.1 BlaR1 family beta-lactam sensor/signal transducer [Parablautia muri]
MAEFGIRFFLCNIFICIIIGFLMIAKRALKNYLTSRMQFNLWFLLLGILAVPFVPFRPASFTQVLALLGAWKNVVSSNVGTITEGFLTPSTTGTIKQMNDLALSVSRKTPSIIGLILCGIWLVGILAMVLFVIKSVSRLNAMKNSALPLQNKTVRILYNNCLRELKIKRNIPLYSTAFLKSPIIVGLFNPRIYLPIHLISDFNAADMRYMLLHELQHYKHKDALAGYLMNFFGVLYWCNPCVWYALKEMRNEREVACDTSVLKLLDESDYEDYGNTLINFAEKVSLTPFPFAAGISGSMKQMQQRIANISSYKKPSVFRKLKGLTAFAAIGVVLFGLAPMLSTYAADQSRYQWNISSDKVSTIDLSAYFNGYEGSFVLYDLKGDTWKVYDMEQATLRTAPNSTYKIYDALFGLEDGVIAPDDSFMAWDGTNYPFEAWNGNQDLLSAMQASVNWYFEEIDKQIGSSAIQSYIRKIGYGNENVNASLSSYWMQGILKISPVEQVELLTALQNNRFGFVPENVNAVKNSICLFSSEGQNFYGKTGTGRVDGQDVNGWFVGYIETAGNTYFFAANIQTAENATGSKASEISLSILSDMGIWKE